MGRFVQPLLPSINPERFSFLNGWRNHFPCQPGIRRLAVAAIAGAAAGWWFGSTYVNVQQKSEISSWLAGIDDLIPSEIQRLSKSNQAIALLIRQANGRFGAADLRRWGPELLEGFSPKTAFSIAPQGVLLETVPSPRSSAWKGVNLLKHPAYQTNCWLAVRERSPILQGPIPLLEGGMSVIVRTPVFVGPQRSFWGFVNALGPWSAWVQTLDEDGKTNRLPIHVGVEVRDGENKTFRTPDYARISERGVQSRTIALPGGSITLAGAPLGLAPSQKALLVLAPLSGAAIGAGMALALGQRQRQQQLREIELELSRLQAMARYRALFEQSLDGVLLIDRTFRFIEANPAVVAMYGVESTDAFLKLSPSDCCPELQPDGRPSAEVLTERLQEAFESGAVGFECLQRRLDTGETWLGLVSLRRIELEHEPVLMARVRDITTSRRYEQRIEDLAYRDALTGLPNRIAIQEWLDQQLQQRPEQRWLLINLDLDDFRSLNTAFSQEQGDQLLRLVARRLIETLSDEARLARLGSDEFLVVLPLSQEDAAEDWAQAEDWCRRLQQRVADAAGDLAAPLPRVSASAGCTALDTQNQETSVLALMQQANTALQQAKQDGRAGMTIYSPALKGVIQERLALEQELEQALAAGRVDQAFRLVYQPQVNRAGRVVRAEALLRFRGRDGAAISPDRFIPLAERSGQIHRLGAWVLDAAFHQQALWRDQGLSLVPLSVNVSARQFDDIAGIPPLLEQLQTLQARYGLEPRHIVLELTETALLRDDQRMQLQLRQLVAAGFKISLDDFGSGYSSLKVLRDYPVAQVKIDKTFVDHVGLDPRSCAIVQALVAITRARRMDLVAEGVETRDQREALVHLGLNFFQGYLFAPGIPPEEFAALLLNPDALASPGAQQQAA